MTTSIRGRPLEFDVNLALDAALDLFWQNGFRDTTTRELELALGVSQSSIYNTFGSKADLLLRAIERYEQRVKGELLGLLIEDEDGYRALANFFGELADWVVRNDHRGCLVVNLMAGGHADPRITQRAKVYRATIRHGLQAALARTPNGPVVAKHRAELLLAAVLGLHITARTSEGTSEVPDMLYGICAQIDAWQAESTNLR